MGFFCFHCGLAQSLSHTRKPPRKATCGGCGADLYVCRNCEFYDVNSYNDCREPLAERVKEKTKANFCDYFRFREAATPSVSGSRTGPVEDPGLLAGEDLFKK